MTAIQEIVAKLEHEAEEADGNIQEGPCEMTKELFRRDETPPKDENPIPQQEPISPKSSPPKNKTGYKPLIKTSPIIIKKDDSKKKPNSGIPRLKSGTNTLVKNPKSCSYRHQSTPHHTTINKNTLEMQFINNKKRLLQLHSELVDKQRPLLDMHKSLLRTKKQLDDLGKKVVLEDLKIMTLKTGERFDGAGENPVVETATNLKSSIDNVLDSCMKVCKKSLSKRDNVFKILENVSKSSPDPTFEAELEELKRENWELEKALESTIKDSDKKLEELISQWQKTCMSQVLNDEVTSKLSQFEETVKQQQKVIAETEDNLYNTTRKYEEKKSSYEKTIGDLHDKINKLEEELKKEKKSANDNLMKSRNLRSKMTEFEVRTREAEEKNNESFKKLSLLQEQMRKKEIQWLKEKDDFKKNEEHLQQKFAEKQSQFDTRLQDMEKVQKNVEMQKENFCRTYQTQLEIKEQELLFLEREKELLREKTAKLEHSLEEMKKQLEQKERELEEMSLKAESATAIEYNNNQWLEIKQYKDKMTEVENSLEKQTVEISKMQSSLKAHAHVASALKLEKDNAIMYANKLRDILQEARDEIEHKDRTIYKLHEKLVLAERNSEKWKGLHEQHSGYVGDKWNKNRCQICMSSLTGERPNSSSLMDTDVRKSSCSSPQYVSESLIGMSVKKVDHLRARLDNLKKMKLPTHTGKNQLNLSSSLSNQTYQSKPVRNNLRKQIEIRGKLYQILQKHADQSCEDFINLLKLTVSNSTKGAQNELKPSNMNEKIDEAFHQFGPSNIQFTESLSAFSQYLPPDTINQICEKLNRSLFSEDDDMSS